MPRRRRRWVAGSLAAVGLAAAGAWVREAWYPDPTPGEEYDEAVEVWLDAWEEQAVDPEPWESEMTPEKMQRFLQALAQGRGMYVEASE